MWNWLFVYAPVIALGLSLLACMASAFSLGWNVYRDVILKPRLKVEFGIRATLEELPEGGLTESGPRFLLLAGVNHGPGDIVCTGATVRRNTFVWSLFEEFPYGFLRPDSEHEYGNQLPLRVAVGEKVKIVFSYDDEGFLSARPNKVGITDSFGRTHWARRKDLRRAIRQQQKDFAGS
jgi:hypothetical protein